MARDDPTSELKQENQQLRQALEQCRKLLDKTEEVLRQAHRAGGVKKD